MTKQLIYTQNVNFGCDPEFFFSKSGKTVGAEKVLPENGLYSGDSKIIIDGVQAELNPSPRSCRALLGSEIGRCFQEINKQLKTLKGLRISSSTTVKVTKKEMSSLSEKSQKFGCSPSKNLSGNSEMSIKDASKYMSRSAGGHIHIGVAGNCKATREVLDNPDTLVQILDIIVGNTCVLIDRDKGNIERRKVYGKAGEYRTPPHGVEYRTLSNFWLRSYQLFGMVMGLTRQSVHICTDGFADKFIKLVDREKIVKAINTNDYDLAMQNFKAILPLLLKITPENNGYSVHGGNIKEFMYFIEKGIDYWFKEEMLEHWVKHIYGKAGFELFLKREVLSDMEKS